MISYRCPKDTILKRHLMESHKSEQVIIRSALERKAAFEKDYGLYVIKGEESQRLVICDGKTLYPVGCYGSTLGNEFLELTVRRLLGREDAVQEIEGTIGLRSWNALNYHPLKKVYAQLKYLRHLITTRIAGGSLHLANDLSGLTAFAYLKNKFEMEELGCKCLEGRDIKLDPVSLRASNPLLLRVKSETVAGVCSSLWSKDIAMINTLYVEERCRNRGYASFLLHNYIAFLLKSTKRVCLFYSVHNETASRIYKKMGFRAEDRWKMTVFTDGCKIKVAPVVANEDI